LVIVGHFSTRYHPTEVLRLLDKKLTDKLKAVMKLWL